MSASLRVLSPREASIFACVADTIVAPEPCFPPVRETSTIAAFDRWLTNSPSFNRVGFRAMVLAAELGPVVAGYGTRLRRLDPACRAEFAASVEGSRVLVVRTIAKLLKYAATLSYYGDDRVLRQVGYDPDANLARGRELRRVEGRP